MAVKPITAREMKRKKVQGNDPDHAIRRSSQEVAHLKEKRWDDLTEGDKESVIKHLAIKARIIQPD